MNHDSLPPLALSFRWRNNNRVEFSALLDVFQHCSPEHPVEPRLIALALPAQPSHYVGVQAHRELLLDGAIEGIADCVTPEFFGEFGEVGEIDFIVWGAVGPGREFCEATLTSRVERASREFLSHGFRLSKGMSTKV